MKIDIKYVESLANILYEEDLSEITVKENDVKISLKREKPKTTVMAQPMVQPMVSPATVTSQVLSKEEEKVEKKGTPILSPMVGTFYNAPGPNENPFVEVGDTVATGQVICIIEAMKLMNEIEADVSGKIIEICVNNGDSVEIGQVLMYVQ